MFSRDVPFIYDTKKVKNYSLEKFYGNHRKNNSDINPKSKPCDS